MILNGNTATSDNSDDDINKPSQIFFYVINTDKIPKNLASFLTVQNINPTVLLNHNCFTVSTVKGGH